MPKLTNFYQQVIDYLQTLVDAGGGGGSGGSSLTIADVITAIDGSEANLGNMELLIGDLINKVNQRSTLTQVQVADAVTTGIQAAGADVSDVELLLGDISTAVNERSTLTQSQVQAAVTTALQNATTLDGVEGLLTGISNAMLSQPAIQAAVTTALQNATTLDGVEGLLTGISNAMLNQAAIQAAVTTALQNATTLDGVETLLSNLTKAWTFATPMLLTEASSSYSSSTNLWTVPAGKEWTFISSYLTYVTSAVVANRTVCFGAQISGRYTSLSKALVAQTASLTRYYNVGPVANSSDFESPSTDYLSIGFASATIPAGGTIGYFITNKDAGDTVTPSLHVLERTP